MEQKRIGLDIDDTILDFQKSERKAMRIGGERIGQKRR